MDPYGLSPEEEQRIVAETLRGQTALQGAQERGGRFGTLAAVTQMANNPALAQAVGAAHKSAQQEANPTRLGSSLMVNGQFLSDPNSMRENMERRAQARGMQADRVQAAAESQQARLAQAAQLAQDRLAAQRESQEGRRALAMSVAALRQGTKADAAADKDAAAVDKRVNNDVQKLSTNVEKAGGAEFAESLGLVNGVMTKYTDPKTGKPLPIPGFGRWEGGIPTAFLGDEAQKARSDMQQAANVLLKSRSGAAVTESEMKRFLTEVGQGAWMDEKTLRNGWANVEKTFGAKLNNILSGFDDTTHKEYVKRGGVDLRTQPWKAKPAANADDELIRKYLPKN